MIKQRVRSNRGFSMVEMVIVVAIMGGIAVMIAGFIGKAPSFIQRYYVRRQLTTESRIATDTITKLLRHGRPGTVIVSTPDTTAIAPPPPNHYITFQSADGTINYDIYWSTSPLNTLYMQETGRMPRKLASNVVGLSFAMDPRDPALVTVSINMEAASDASGRNDSLYKIAPINQTVRVGSTP